jgi:hypothetical protein
VVNRHGRSLPVALLLVLLLALSASPVLTHPARAAAPQPDAANAALDWLRTQQQPDGGFSAFGGESDASVSADVVYAFAAGGIHPNSVVSAADASALDYLRSVATQEVANPGRAAKLALALHVAGDNPRDVGGVDLVNVIESGLNSETGWYGESFFGHTLAVLALASQAVPIPAPAIDALGDRRAAGRPDAGRLVGLQRRPDGRNRRFQLDGDGDPGAGRGRWRSRGDRARS